MNLSTFVSQLNRVGKTLEKRLKILGIQTVRDLLFYFPFRYEDYRKVASIKELKEGEQVTVKATIELIANRRSPRRRTNLTEAVVADDTGRLRIVWFNQPFLTKTLQVGDSVFFSGKVKRDMLGLSMVGPMYEKMRGNLTTTHTARLVPIYPLTAGITQKQIRFLLSQVIHFSHELPDWVPVPLLQSAKLVSLAEALRWIHFPKDDGERTAAERRLKFDELFLLQLRAEMVRQSLVLSSAPPIVFREKETKEFVEHLPFTLTKDQKIAAWEILKDIQKDTPMNRLLQGEVGSGKTVVAGIAAQNVALSGYQTVFLAPTEVLAFQHYATLQRLFQNAGVSIGLLTRSRQEIYGDTIAIVVGTHALLSDEIVFHKLGLVIVDEQHRFGVEQRKRLREVVNDDGTKPHFLSMTATPIPRSLALTLYGDLDVSFIRTLPVERKPIISRVVEPHNREKAYNFIKDQVRRGRQIFVICPLIEEKKEEFSIFPAAAGQFSKTIEQKSVVNEYKKLSEKIFQDLRVGFLHGKLKSNEKEDTMKQFYDGKIDVLVSTSVVEVGVNIQNASVMMIEGAERFGLAQLHQFRGRVGRSVHQSYCLLFSDQLSQRAAERLQFFAKTSDGFVLAEYDLHDRGPGEVYGTEQSGMMNLRLATMKDVELIKLARDLARGIDFSTYPALKEKVKEWEEQVHLE